MLAVGFLLRPLAGRADGLWAAALSDHTFEVSGFFWALLVALVAAAVTVVLEVLLGTNDDDVYSLRVTQRIARRSKARQMTDVPGVVYLEIDGLARPVLQSRPARRARAGDGALARVRLPRALGVGD